MMERSWFPFSEDVQELLHSVASLLPIANKLDTQAIIMFHSFCRADIKSGYGA